ncbi:MAG TPA: N,N-dimethylformamidase beta subunit family domain-containing protein, partial [Acidimicrobiales bacterium]|nr:N,N-dimethylformamidase beta subunit family domain-containing protein [Acidimicrobiales bacterium]
GGQQSWVPLTVRDDSSRAAYVIVNAVTTWQAYNTFGGYDLYQGLAAHGSSFANRSRVVSFDRPYAFGSGAADFYGNEYPLVRLVEKLGLDVTYTTDVDLDEQPGRLKQHGTVVSLGHDEYWSSTMRDGVTTARDAGVNLVFLGANAIYRHIRLGPSPLGPDRHEVCYKSASEDPLNGRDDAEVTVDWPSPPVPRPEQTVIGDQYRCNPVRAPFVMVDPRSWIAAGTGLAAGGRLPGLVGSEYDRYVPSLPGPRNVEIVGHSPLTCRGAPDWSDATYYTEPGAGGVFASGTNLWVASLGGACSSPCEIPAVTRMTANVLARFGRGPAGVTAPSSPNWTAFYPGGSAPPGGGSTTTTVQPESSD